MACLEFRPYYCPCFANQLTRGVIEKTLAYLNLRQAKALVRAGLDQPVLAEQCQEEAEENHLKGWPEKEVSVFMRDTLTLYVHTREVGVALDKPSVT